VETGEGTVCDVEWFSVGFFAPTTSSDQKLAAAVLQHRLKQAAEEAAGDAGAHVTFYKTTKGVRRSRLGPNAGLLDGPHRLIE
jgi:hypothetical protein